MAQQALMSNPQFAEWYRQNQGKTVEQVARENGIDLDMLRRIFQ